MSSYPVLDNKPIDQWKVTELKEELKRRKLKVNGLKDDLIRRLFESMQNEVESAKVNDDNNGFASALKHVRPLEPKTVPLVDERTRGVTDKNEKGKNGLDIDIVQPSVTGFTTEKVIEENTEETSVQVTTLETSVEGMTVETNLEVAAVVSVVSESLVTEGTLSGQELQNNEFQNKIEDLCIQLQSKDSSPPHEAKRSSFDLDNQVYDISKVTTDSISTDNVSINEKIELKDNIIADGINLEFDVNPEMEEPSSSNVVLDEGNLQPMNVEEPQGNEISVEETGKNADNSASASNISCEDIGISEKLNLDRSSGDDFLDEDTLDNKQIHSKSISDEVCDKGERIEEPVMIEDTHADAMVDDLCTEKKVENINDLAVASMKRKLYGQETVAFSETTKRQRRWNPDGLKVVETQSSSIAQSTTPMDAFQSTTPRDAFQATAKCEFSRSNSTASDETLKEERVVPPSAMPSTNSLRIDRFLRPFTLKAVQELLGKKGTVTNFWMDHIKTHCYVTYSSVEEAIETRNAIYNLQWPKNGGRLLIAEFVEPQEVQMRVEAPPSPATPVSTVPTLPPTLVPIQAQHSPRLQVQRQMLPPLPPLPASVLPPPPLSNPPPARERALPPPPPRPAKAVDPPIVTLDDLFRKTRATPRIYYLPLSDEQVAAKQKAQGKTIEQSLD